MGPESEIYASPEAPTGRCGHCGTLLAGGRRHRQYCTAVCRAQASQRRREARIEEVLTDLERLTRLLRRPRRRTG
jgi:hypothetical protein